MKVITFKAIITSSILLFSSLCFAQDSAWPRSFTNADGSVTVIESAPKRIISTSVSLTGTLLAMDTPLIGSAGAVKGEYFSQWDEVAKERGLTNLWPAGSVDLESAYAVEPDLIIVSLTGADSALEQVEEFRQIAPTVILDYSIQSWQDLAKQIGELTGLEQQVAEKLADYERYVARTKQTLAIPEGQANIISYHGAGMLNAIGRPQGAHAMLLTSLGFDIEAPNDAWQSSTARHRDFIRVHYENLSLLKGETTFLIEADGRKAHEFMSNEVFINMPSVQNQQVYGLGLTSFRIDPYSARNIIDNIAKQFAKNAE